MGVVMIRSAYTRGRAIPRWQTTAVSAAALVLVLMSTAFAGLAQGMPSSPTDQSKVPHYFGPWPNWANSPLTKADATVMITGNGTGATAEATVGANGAVTGLNLTNPGRGYTAGNTTVTITGSGSGAAATADVVTTSSVTKVTVDNGGAGYVKPSVSIDGGGPRTAAAAHALGGVDAVTLDKAQYGGYTFPTVGFDLPDDPSGIQAKGHATCLEVDCKPASAGGTVTVTGVVVDDPGIGIHHRTWRRRARRYPVRPGQSRSWHVHSVNGHGNLEDRVGRR